MRRRWPAIARHHAPRRQGLTNTDQVGGSPRPSVVAGARPGPGGAVEAIAPGRVGILTTEQLARIVRLLKAADGVELKVSVHDGDRRSAVAALDMDPLDAQIRQVVFFDTPDLLLDRHGVVVRARRVQGKVGDSIVKLRPLDPQRLAATNVGGPGVRRRDRRPPGRVRVLGQDEGEGRQRRGPRHDRRSSAAAEAVHEGAAGPLRGPCTRGCRARRPLRVGADQRPQAQAHTGRLPPPGRGGAAAYPDGAWLLELSIKCQPTEAFDAAAESRRFLSAHGIDLVAEQQTKTRTALDYFASELVGGM